MTASQILKQEVNDCLCQRWSNYGPQAACGPQGIFVQTVDILENFQYTGFFYRTSQLYDTLCSNIHFAILKTKVDSVS